MPERNQGNHWDFLAADLGAQPEEPRTEKEAVDETEADEIRFDLEGTGEERPAESAAGETALPEEPEKTQGRGGGRVVSGFGYRRGSVDWANLARELGAEATEEAPEPIRPMEMVGDAPASTKPLEAESLEDEFPFISPRSGAAKPASGEFGAGILDEIEIVETDEAEADSDEGLTETEKSEEERTGRRRRRRRKPRKPRDEQQDEIVEVEESDEEVDFESLAEESPVESPREGKSRRRGRRRGTRKRSARDESEAVAEDSEAHLELAEVLGEELEDAGEEDAQPDDFDQDEEEGKGGKRVTHRGIPTWGEAVGFIIDVNMESRAKRPDAGGSRYRSGRRQGGDKSGNRGRP